MVVEHAAKDSFDEVVAEVEAVTGCVIGNRQEEARWSGQFGAVNGDTGEATAGAGRASFR